MIKSMTGFGKGEGGGFVVEMRSVNHKFLDLSLKVPRDILQLENRLKKKVGETLSRGRIDIFITRGGVEEAPKAFRLNAEAAKQYIALFDEMKDTFGLPGEVDISLLSQFREILAEVEAPEDADVIWAALDGPLGLAVESLNGMRAQEGAALASDIKARALFVASNLEEIGKRSPVVVDEYAKRLKERVEVLAGGIELDQSRLLQEIALFAERSDITEEIVRGRSHLAQLDTMLQEDGPVGRKMDFLLQEINREVNTIGSKASDRDIAVRVVDMKSELEKIREQVQNIE
jgi:uncharacterized protein (TIGR00255 family)